MDYEKVLHSANIGRVACYLAFAKFPLLSRTF